MSKGLLCLTFDDFDPKGWREAIPLFDHYHAHATFSFSGAVSEDMLGCMKELKMAGHTIGLHTVHHALADVIIQESGKEAYWSQEVKPQLDACQAAGIVPTVFAFPNNRFNDEALELLLPFFHHFRAGVRKDSREERFIPLETLSADHRVMRGLGIGAFYHTRLEDILDDIDYAANHSQCLTFYSHSIVPNATGVHMPLEFLEAILQRAFMDDCRMIGFDELPR